MSDDAGNRPDDESLARAARKLVAAIPAADLQKLTRDKDVSAFLWWGIIHTHARHGGQTR